MFRKICETRGSSDSAKFEPELIAGRYLSELIDILPVFSEPFKFMYYLYIQVSGRLLDRDYLQIAIAT